MVGVSFEVYNEGNGLLSRDRADIDIGLENESNCFAKSDVLCLQGRKSEIFELGRFMSPAFRKVLRGFNPRAGLSLELFITEKSAFGVSLGRAW